MINFFFRPLPSLLAIALSAQGLYAFDVSPSRETGQNFNQGTGKKFDIFAGDPERIQRANRVERKEFKVEPLLEIRDSSTPKLLEIVSNRTSEPSTIRAGLLITSTSKNPRTFSFPDAKRIDILIKDATGKERYRWSGNKRFAQSIGTSMVMPGERLRFAVEFKSDAIQPALSGGTYTVEMQLANYPDFTATETLTVGNKAPAAPPVTP
jgi:hypothetical protein